MIFIRSLLFHIVLYATTVVGCLAAALFAPFGATHVAQVARVWAYAWLTAYRVICGVKLCVVGADQLPSGACIVAMKHQSTWDTFALFAIFKRPIYVLKSDLMWIPVFGWVLRCMGCISVQRGAGGAALDSLISGGRRACNADHQIVIFPEGTRTFPGAQTTYKSGVSYLYQALDVPCIPVAVNSGRLWPRHSFIRPAGTITVEILPAIPPGLQRKVMLTRLVEDIEEASRRLHGSTQ